MGDQHKEFEKLVTENARNREVARNFFVKYAIGTHSTKNSTDKWVHIYFKDGSCAKLYPEEWTWVRGW